MRKIENLKVFGESDPDDLSAAYMTWVKEMSEQREKNVAVSSVPFYSDIISRSLMPTGKGKFALAVFFHDYVLAPHEAGGARHHPDEAEGVSAIGPDTPKRRR